MDIFKLYRHFWDFAFQNPEKIKPNHCAVYSFSIEHCNRLGWKKKFGFPTSMAMEATGIKSYSVYKKAFDDLVDFGFFEVVQYSKNQYSSNIIALKENYKALDKALDKALLKHTSKQSESTEQSIDSIDKPLTKEPLTINQELELERLCSYFGIGRINNAKSFHAATYFIEKIVSDGRFDYFAKQLPAYIALATKGGWKHKLQNFIGLPEKNYEDGAWCAETYSVIEKGKPERSMMDSLKTH